MNRVVVIYGPTAVGKSAIGVELAKMLDGEIISADSMQIYKHLDIGSAKVTKDETNGIKHHLIDILEPTQDYSASEFVDTANKLCKDIINRGKTAIIVGGTGLYINGLIKGFNFGDTEKNEAFRNSLSDMSNEEIYNKILELNPEEIVDKNNRRRLVRVLERLTFGEKVSKTCDNELDFKLFAIIDDRQKIYERINARVDKMLNEGLLDEAKYLYSLHLPEDNLAMKAIGYKEIFPYIEGKKDLSECAEILKQKTRNYAKRQFTFMNQFDNLTKVRFCGIHETAKRIYNLLKGENDE